MERASPGDHTIASARVHAHSVVPERSGGSGAERTEARRRDGWTDGCRLPLPRGGRTAHSSCLRGPVLPAVEYLRAHTIHPPGQAGRPGANHPDRSTGSNSDILSFFILFFYFIFRLEYSPPPSRRRS